MTTVTNEDAFARLQEARKALDVAFAYAVSTEEMRTIYKAIREVDNEIVEVLKKRMAAALQDYVPDALAMAEVNRHLKKIRDQIDQIVFAAETATQVITGLTRLITILP